MIGKMSMSRIEPSSTSMGATKLEAISALARTSLIGVGTDTEVVFGFFKVFNRFDQRARSGKSFHCMFVQVVFHHVVQECLTSHQVGMPPFAKLNIHVCRC